MALEFDRSPGDFEPVAVAGKRRIEVARLADRRREPCVTEMFCRGPLPITLWARKIVTLLSPGVRLGLRVSAAEMRMSASILLRRAFVSSRTSVLLLLGPPWVGPGARRWR